MAGGKAPEATSFDNFDFGIEDTGIGNAELLEGLMSDDTDPDDLEELDEDEDEQPKKKKKPAATVAKKKVTAKPAAEDEDEEEDEDDEFSLQNQFDDDDEDEDEEEEEVELKLKTPAKKKTKEAPAEEEEEDEDEEEDEGPQTPFTPIARELFRLGVFTQGDDEEDVPEIASPEQFLERFEIEKKRGASQVLESFLSKYGEDYREAFQAIFINGVSPKEYLATYDQVETFKGLELDGNEPAQERVVREAMKSQGFDIDDIDAEVERLKQYGDLESTSKRYHKVLVKKEEKRLQDLSDAQAKKKADDERADQAYQASVHKILTEKARARDFDGITVTPQAAQETLDYLATKKYKTPSGELLTEFDKDLLELKRPENHEMRVKLALLLRQKLDLSKVKRAAVTKESKGLFADLTTQRTKTSSGKKGTKQKVSSWFGS